MERPSKAILDDLYKKLKAFELENQPSTFLTVEEQEKKYKDDMDTVIEMIKWVQEEAKKQIKDIKEKQNGKR